jgi:hypothetical protein
MGINYNKKEYKEELKKRLESIDNNMPIIHTPRVPFHLSRVVTKDLITDSFQGLRNMFGLRLRGYEKMLNKHIEEIMNDLKVEYTFHWFRISINSLTNGSVMITVYGEGTRNE